MGLQVTVTQFPDAHRYTVKYPIRSGMQRPVCWAVATKTEVPEVRMVWPANVMVDVVEYLDAIAATYGAFNDAMRANPQPHPHGLSRSEMPAYLLGMTLTERIALELPFGKFSAVADAQGFRGYAVRTTEDVAEPLAALYEHTASTQVPRRLLANAFGTIFDAIPRASR